MKVVKLMPCFWLLNSMRHSRRCTGARPVGGGGVVAAAESPSARESHGTSIVPATDPATDPAPSSPIQTHLQPAARPTRAAAAPPRAPPGPTAAAAAARGRAQLQRWQRRLPRLRPRHRCWVPVPLRRPVAALSAPPAQWSQCEHDFARVSLQLQRHREHECAGATLQRHKKGKRGAETCGEAAAASRAPAARAHGTAAHPTGPGRVSRRLPFWC
jgi:hypothetical protein